MILLKNLKYRLSFNKNCKFIFIVNINEKFFNNNKY